MKMYKYINKCINQKYLSLTVVISISFVMIFVKKKNIFFVLLNSQDFTLHLQKLRARLMQKNKIYLHRIPRMF